MSSKRNRSYLEKAIISTQKRINILSEKLYQLKIEEATYCDIDSWYEENQEEVIIKKRPLLKENHLIGRKYWIEDFIDEDTGMIVGIQRCRIIRKDDNWLI